MIRHISNDHCGMPRVRQQLYIKPIKLALSKSSMNDTCITQVVLIILFLPPSLVYLYYAWFVRMASANGTLDNAEIQFYLVGE